MTLSPEAQKVLEKAAGLQCEELYAIVKRRYPEAPYPSADYFVRGTVYENVRLLPIIQALLAENSKLVEAIKIARKDERERIFEDAGCPGFDGPMTIETKYDDILASNAETMKRLSEGGD